LTLDNGGAGFAFGTGEHTLDAQLALADDEDGVDASVEDAAPNDGDGDHDGTPDSEQGNVASLPAAAGGGYVTVTAPPALRLSNVATSNPTSPSPPEGVSLPHGTVSFAVEGISPPGSSVQVDVIFHAASGELTYYKLQRGSWSDFSEHTVIDGNRATLTLRDGGAGDADLAADGRIIDPGGVATVDGGTEPPGPDVSLVRIFGPDAIGTAIAISHASFDDGGAQAVVLARSDFFSDALAGGPLAAAKHAPMLITPGAPQRASLDARIRAEITRVLPEGGTVYVLGGPLALHPDLDAELANLGYEVVRVAGVNLFATAVEIAEQLGAPGIVFEVTGLHFADALSAVPAAVKAHGAILLTDGTSQAPETAAFLADHPNTIRIAIGGPLAAFGADPTASPVYGQDLFETSAAVAARFFPAASRFALASGVDFPDALTGGPFVATSDPPGPMLLVSPSMPVPTSVLRYIQSRLDGAEGWVFGGPLAVSDAVYDALSTVMR
jgi:hypothetical protein